MGIVGGGANPAHFQGQARGGPSGGGGWVGGGGFSGAGRGGGGGFTRGGVGGLIVSHDAVFRRRVRIVLGLDQLVFRSACEGAHGGQQDSAHSGRG